MKTVASEAKGGEERCDLSVISTRARRGRLRRFGVLMFSVLFAGAVAIPSLLPSKAVASDSTVRVFSEFSISIAAIPVGAADVSTTFQGKSYRITANGRTAGVSRLVSDGKGQLVSSGRLNRGRVLPASFAMETKDDKVETRVRMQMSNQSIERLTAMPPLAKREDRIPVLREHYKSVLDPLGAFLIPLDDDGRIEPERACNRSIPVFDGWQRFNVNLSFKEKRDAKLGGRDGYRGPVVVCAARYEPIAGHRPSRKSTVYLQNNKNMELWLAPVSGLPVLMPVHIKIGTRLGPLTLSTEELRVDFGSTQAASSN